MTLKKAIIITCLAGLVLLPTGLTAQGQINLSKSSAMSELPYIVVLANGDLMAAWTDGGHFNGGGAVYFALYNEKTGWSAMKQVAEATSAFPQLAVDKYGDVHMAYWEGAGSYSRDIYYRRYSNGRWSEKELVYDSWMYNSSWQRISIDGNTISILWCHNYAKPTPMDVVLIQKPIGGTWPLNYVSVSRAPSSTSIHPALATKNGNVYAVWQEDKHSLYNWNIYYADRINGYWSNPVRLHPDWNQYQSHITLDSQNQVHLIYSGRGGPIYYTRKTTAGGWTERQVISSAGTDITTFNFITFAGGMLHAVWRQREGDGQYIFYSQGSTSGKWGIPIKVSHGGQSEFPGLDVDNKGRVHVVYSDIGVGGERDVFYVRVDQVTSFPVALLAAVPYQGDAPLYVNFDASESYDPDGRIVTYQWEFGDGSTGSGVTSSHTYTAKGVYTAKLSITDDEKNTSIATQDITVGRPPTAVINAGPTAGSSPLTVQFDASQSNDPDGTIVSYNWEFGDGSSGSGKFATHTYQKLGNFTATLTVKDNEGFEASASVEIKVSSTPIANFTYSPRKGQPPLKVNFDASNSKPADKVNGKVANYEWDFDDGKTGVGKKVSHVYSKPGSYSAILKITDDQGMVDSTRETVEIYTIPVARFTLNPAEGVAPLKVHFNASASSDEDGKIGQYKWTFGDGTIGYGETISHTYTKGGGFTIWLSVTDNDGWSNATNKSISVIEKPYSPLNFSIKKIVNQSLYFNDYFCRLTWKKNPKNTGLIQVAKYVLYRKQMGDAQFIWLDEVDSSTFLYEDYKITSQEQLDNTLYAIKAVDHAGRMSDFQLVDPVQPGQASPEKISQSERNSESRSVIKPPVRGKRQN